ASDLSEMADGDRVIDDGNYELDTESHYSKPVGANENDAERDERHGVLGGDQSPQQRSFPAQFFESDSPLRAARMSQSRGGVSAGNERHRDEETEDRAHEGAAERGEDGHEHSEENRGAEQHDPRWMLRVG